MVAENLRAWRTTSEKMYGLTGDTLEPALEHMNASLARSQAGATHARLTARWPVMMAELTEAGRRIVATWNPGLTRVSEAQAGAGGSGEVYGVKQAAG